MDWESYPRTEAMDWESSPPGIIPNQAAHLPKPPVVPASETNAVSRKSIGELDGDIVKKIINDACLGIIKDIYAMKMAKPTSKKTSS